MAYPQLPYKNNKKSGNPPGWEARCRVSGCSGFANRRCPRCKKPMCEGCAVVDERLDGDGKSVCRDCFNED